MMEDILRKILAGEFALIGCLNLIIYSFMLHYLKSKPLGSQTFYDKVCKLYLRLSMIQSLLFNGVMSLAHISAIGNNFIALILTFLMELTGSLVLASFLFCLIVKTLLIYSTLLNEAFDENKVVKKYVLFSGLFLTLLALIEFGFITDGQDLTFFQMLTEQDTSERNWSKINQGLFLLIFVYFISLQGKLEMDKYSNLDQDKHKIRFSILAILVFIILTSLSIFDSSQISETLMVMFLHQTYFVYLPLMYAWNHDAMWKKIQRMLVLFEPQPFEINE